MGELLSTLTFCRLESQQNLEELQIMTGGLIRTNGVSEEKKIIAIIFPGSTFTSLIKKSHR